MAIAKGRLNPSAACAVPAPQAFNGQFDVFEFEARVDGLWLSFRNLPFVKLECLDDGLYFDDRSIQRQFKFAAPDEEGSSPSIEVRVYGEAPGRTSRS